MADPAPEAVPLASTPPARPKGRQHTPSGRSPESHSTTPGGDKRRSPRTPDSKPRPPIPSPLTPLASKYAAGVLPITYHEDKDTKERIWKILLLIEYRDLERRKCVHPLAGKKEVIDNNNPIKTAAREFHEETSGVFKDFVELEQQLFGNAQEHQLHLYFPESKMFFFLTFVPHYEDIQSRFLSCKSANAHAPGSEEDGQFELFWYPLEDLLRLQSKMTYRHEDLDVAPSICAAAWFSRRFLVTKIRSFQTETEKRLASTQSPLSRVPLPIEVEINIDELALELETTQIGGDTPTKLRSSAPGSSSTPNKPKGNKTRTPKSNSPKNQKPSIVQPSTSSEVSPSSIESGSCSDRVLVCKES